MMTTTYLHHEQPSEINLQSSVMELAIKRYVTTLVIITLTILARVQFVNGQPQQRSDTPAKSVALAPPTSDLTTEIATMLRAYYDAWTKLDAAAVNAAVATDGFVTVEGKVLTGSVFKSSVRAVRNDTNL